MRFRAEDGRLFVPTGSDPCDVVEVSEEGGPTEVRVAVDHAGEVAWVEGCGARAPVEGGEARLVALTVPCAVQAVRLDGYVTVRSERAVVQVLADGTPSQPHLVLPEGEHGDLSLVLACRDGQARISTPEPLGCFAFGEDAPLPDLLHADVLAVNGEPVVGCDLPRVQQAMTAPVGEAVVLEVRDRHGETWHYDGTTCARSMHTPPDPAYRAQVNEALQRLLGE